MTPAQFEQILHPIFQEDEFTLIMAGAVLGAITGGLQWLWNVRQERHTREDGGDEKREGKVV